MSCVICHVSSVNIFIKLFWDKVVELVGAVEGLLSTGPTRLVCEQTLTATPLTIAPIPSELSEKKKQM